MSKQSFGERMGFTNAQPIQVDSMDIKLRSDLYNVFYLRFLEDCYNNKNSKKKLHDQALRIIWYDFMGKTVDIFDRVTNTSRVDSFTNFFMKAKFTEIYAFHEYILNTNFGQDIFKPEVYKKIINTKLEKNNSAYRYVVDRFINVTNNAEMDAIEDLQSTALKNPQLGVRTHLKAAINHLSNTDNPDYRGSIRESITMVESVARYMNPKSQNLGDALKKLKDREIIGEPLSLGFEKIYGFTNGKNGLRHAHLDPNQVVTETDARFFLVACSAFTNYLIEKAREFDLLEK